MAGIGFNASQAWQPEVYVKYGIVNRIPCTVSSSYTGTFKNGTVVGLTGNYEVSNTIGGLALGIAVAQNQVDYTNPANLSVSVMIPTPGAVVSVPVSCFASGASIAVNAFVYANSQGELVTDSTKSFNAMLASAVCAFAQIIAVDQEYADLIFPTAGQTTLFPTGNSTGSSN